jgi:hypothetical protein
MNLKHKNRFSSPNLEICLSSFFQFYSMNSYLFKETLK